MLGPKNIGSKQILGPKNLGSEWFWVKQIVGSNKFSGWKIISVQKKFYVQKNVGSKKKFGSKKKVLFSLSLVNYHILVQCTHIQSFRPVALKIRTIPVRVGSGVGIHMVIIISQFNWNFNCLLELSLAKKRHIN